MGSRRVGVAGGRFVVKVGRLGNLKLNSKEFGGVGYTCQAIWLEGLTKRN